MVKYVNIEFLCITIQTDSHTTYDDGSLCWIIYHSYKMQIPIQLTIQTSVFKLNCFDTVGLFSIVAAINDELQPFKLEIPPMAWKFQIRIYSWFSFMSHQSKRIRWAGASKHCLLELNCTTQKKTPSVRTPLLRCINEYFRNN